MKEVRIEPTNICNARCVMCPREKQTRALGIMDMKLYKKIINQIINLGADTVSLENFGEPFIDPFIIDRAKYAKSKGLKVLTITNASLLSEKTCKEIALYFDTVRVSMYGVTKNTYEKVHRGLSFDEAQKNISCLLKYRGKTKVYIYFLEMDQNKHETKKFIEIYEPLCNGISVWKPHNWVHGRKYRDCTGNAVSCGRPQTGPLQIQWDGTVVACCYDYDNINNLGDLKRQTVTQVLNNFLYKDIIDSHNRNDYTNYPLCAACDQLHKRKDVLIYSNIKNTAVGKINTTFTKLVK